jgi:hypothetical protein
MVGALPVSTASIGQAGTFINNAVAFQLESMAAALNTLIDRYDSTRCEVAVELAAHKMATTHVSAGSN